MYTEFHELPPKNERPMKILLLRKIYRSYCTFIMQFWPWQEISLWWITVNMSFDPKTWQRFLIMPSSRCMGFRAEALIFSLSEVPHGLSIFYSNEEKGIYFYTFVGNTKFTASKIPLHQQTLQHCFSVKFYLIYCWFTLFF